SPRRRGSWRRCSTSRRLTTAPSMHRGSPDLACLLGTCVNVQLVPSTMNAMRNRTIALAALIGLAACHSAPPPPPPAPIPLSDSANAAVQWIQAHAAPLAAEDSTPNASERAEFGAL